MTETDLEPVPSPRRDKAVFATLGPTGARQGLRPKAAVAASSLMSIMRSAANKPEPILESIKKWRNSLRRGRPGVGAALTSAP